MILFILGPVRENLRLRRDRLHCDSRGHDLMKQQKRPEEAGTEPLIDDYLMRAQEHRLYIPKWRMSVLVSKKLDPNSEISKRSGSLRGQDSGRPGDC
jgi:hypothetical protein